ncbi:MAG: protein kinase [Acidobacteriota bacterium]|jgi:Tol biopolymer transport system component
MALSAGTRLGPYEILEPLGAGGMGEVYRARDPRLKRDVALKVLPEDLASEPERLERFEREAQTLAALNHPHIVTIFSVEEAENLRFLTMELVEGTTLTRATPRGGFPLSRVFPIAIQLTEAVNAAHEKGIIHRDLKPGNVMVMEEDRVKVLDFGLAKLREGVRGAADTQSPTEPATGPGRILGTAPYMSPEQIQGKALDHRSDVFSLGVILYQMATGERPFGGETFAEVASSILRDTPRPVTELRSDLPRDVARLVKHCLEKEPKRRFQTVLDLRNELEELKHEADSGELLSAEQALKAAPPRGRPRWLGAAAALVILGIAVAGGWLWSSRGRDVPTAPLEITPFTSDGGLKRFPQLSPNGEKVAYAWTGTADDNWDIYVKALGVGTRPLRLTENPAAEVSPTWSPDERQIAFVRGMEGAATYTIYTVPSLGGQERRLVDYVGEGLFYDRGPALSWSPDGESLVYAEKDAENEPSRIVQLSLETLEKRVLTTPREGTAGDWSPALSPDGSLLAFMRSAAVVGPWDVWVQPMAGGEARRLTRESYVWCQRTEWTPDGREILFTLGGGIIRRVSLAGGHPQLIPGVGRNARNASVRGGRMVFEQWTSLPPDIWRAPGRRASLPDRAAEKLIVSSGEDHSPDYSPDGRGIVFLSSRTGVQNIWVCDSDGSNPVQLTDFDSLAGSPRWSPDGLRIAFDSAEAGDFNIHTVDADGGIPRRLTQDPSDEYLPSWSRDGRWVYFGSRRSGSEQVWKIPAEGGQAIQVTRNGGGQPEESWDGRDLYYRRREGLWRMPAEGGEETRVLGERLLGGEFHRWAVVQDGLYVPRLDGVRGRRLEFAIRFFDFESGQVTELFRKEGPFGHGRGAVSPDEEWILYSETPLPTSELMLVENFR